MKDYRNMSCAACGVVFDENSDIVVCPECGAPHHRECWKAEGHCACENEHSDQYTWKPERVVIGNTFEQESTNNQNNSDRQSDTGKKSEEKITCPICGNETQKSKEYCERCGYYLAHSRDGAYSNNSGNLNFLFDFDESELINGVPAGDVKKFVGNMWMYYIPRFILFVRRKSSVSFNFTACLTHCLWFIARKMYGIGAALAALMLGITAYQAYFYNALYSVYGSSFSDITAYDLLAEHRGLFFGMAISGALWILEFIVMLMCGLFANKIYMNFCTKKIKKINAKATFSHVTAEQFNEALKAEGGIAALQTFSVGLCYLIVLYIFENGLLF